MTLEKAEPPRASTEEKDSQPCAAGTSSSKALAALARVEEIAGKQGIEALLVGGSSVHEDAIVDGLLALHLSTGC